MSTQIDKKDTWDIADDISRNIAITIVGRLEKGMNIDGHIWVRDIIHEGLNDWISDCEDEDSQWKRYNEEGNPINV